MFTWQAREEPTSTNIVTIYESFYFRGHLCITFALHDISLYELIKRNNFQVFTFSLNIMFIIVVVEQISFFNCEFLRDLDFLLWLSQYFSSAKSIF